MQPGLDFRWEGRKERQGWVWIRCYGGGWTGLVGKAEGALDGRLIVSELNPQFSSAPLWGRHWEVTSEDTGLKEGQ